MFFDAGLDRANQIEIAGKISVCARAEPALERRRNPVCAADQVLVGKQGATGIENRHHPRRRVIQ
jgi:hypothetical protein